MHTWMHAYMHIEHKHTISCACRYIYFLSTYMGACIHGCMHTCTSNTSTPCHVYAHIRTYMQLRWSPPWQRRPVVLKLGLEPTTRMLALLPNSCLSSPLAHQSYIRAPRWEVRPERIFVQRLIPEVDDSGEETLIEIGRRRLRATDVPRPSVRHDDDDVDGSSWLGMPLTAMEAQFRIERRALQQRRALEGDHTDEFFLELVVTFRMLMGSGASSTAEKLHNLTQSDPAALGMSKLLSAPEPVVSVIVFDAPSPPPPSPPVPSAPPRPPQRSAPSPSSRAASSLRRSCAHPVALRLRRGMRYCP